VSYIHSSFAATADIQTADVAPEAGAGVAGHSEGEGVLHSDGWVQVRGGCQGVDAMLGGWTTQAQRAHDGVQERLAHLSCGRPADLLQHPAVSVEPQNKMFRDVSARVQYRLL
jgi:hypothetical protein